MQNMYQALMKTISMNGFLMYGLVAEYGMEPWIQEFLPLLRDQKIKYREQKTQGLENLAEGFVQMLKGENQGKAVIVVAED